MSIVFLTEKPSLLDASCCSVEVVNGAAGFLGPVETAMNVIVGGNCLVQGNVISNCGGHVLAAKKNFDIPHPTREGYRLRHTCPEGPSNDVYCRGKVVNKREILLPAYFLPTQYS